MFANRAERPDPDRGIASFLYAMYRGGMTEKPEIKLTHAENNPWYKFMVETLRLDKKYEEPRGWNWFSAFKDLSNVELALVQEKFSKEHPFKSKTPMQSFLRPELSNAVIWLKSELKNIGDIEEIDFSRLSFNDVDFSFFVFPIKVSFENAVFYGSTNFENVLFFGNSHLSEPNRVYTNATNSESANFRGVHFYGKAIFTNAIFSESVNFSDAVFDGMADFTDVVFHTLILFCDVTFHFIAYFIGAKFFSTTGFSNTKFLSAVNFSNATFVHGVSFSSIKTSSSTDFSKTNFKNSTPEFYNADLHSNIILDRDVKLWPQIDWSNIDDNYKRQMINNQNAYENLTSHMKKLDKYHDEHFFYREEMRCRRWLERNPCISFSYWLYEKLSDNGYGIGRALFWWSFHILLGAVLIFDRTKTACNKNCDLIDNFYFDLVVSFANAHGVLFFSNGPLKEHYTVLKAVAGFNVIWGIQTVLGIIFLFLLLLTLRIRFRLK